MAAHQAPLSLGFSRQEHWSGLPFPSPMHACMLSCFSHVQVCVTLWTAAHQAPLSTGFSRQEYWSGLPFPSLLCPWGLEFCQMYLFINNHIILSFILLVSCSVSSIQVNCVWLCDPMDCSTPGLPVHHQHLEFTQTHVHWVGDAIQPSHPLSSPSPPTFNLSQHRVMSNCLFFSIKSIFLSWNNLLLILLYYLSICYRVEFITILYIIFILLRIEVSNISVLISLHIKPCWLYKMREWFFFFLFSGRYGIHLLKYW